METEELMTFEEIKAEVNQAIENMAQRTNEWVVRHTLTKLTHWAFWEESIMASVDTETADKIVDSARSEMEHADESFVLELYEVVYRFV